MLNKKENIKYIVIDVDGTLTDGTINISDRGELYKSFYCRDGLAIIDAREKGIKSIILTSRNSEIVSIRANEIGITDVLQNAGKNKSIELTDYCKRNKIDFSQVAYIGDDRNDIEAMKLCSIIGCPYDAINDVKEIADFISSHSGGRGAVREFIDWLLYAK